MNLTNLPEAALKACHYIILALMVLYTIQSVTVFRQRQARARDRIFLRQNVEMFLIHFLGFLSLYLNSYRLDLVFFYLAQVLYLMFTLLLFRNLYPRSSKSLINNMCMLLSVGFIMVTRFSMDQAIKQFEITAAGTALALLVPLVVRKLLVLTRMTWGYVFVGIGLLGLVMIAARVTNGARLSISVAGFSLQPSEFVKIIFVFAIAGLLSTEHSFRRIVIATILAAAHVLILVISTDLGSALIFFVTYLIMLFVATRNPFLMPRWQLISCSRTCGSVSRSGAILSRIIPDPAIRSVNRCLRLPQAAGSAQGCAREAPARFRMCHRTLCSVPFLRKWERCSGSA